MKVNDLIQIDRSVFYNLQTVPERRDDISSKVKQIRQDVQKVLQHKGNACILKNYKYC